jgi:hypothetical protein
VSGERAFLRKDLRHFDLVWALPNPETNEIYCRYRARR